MEKETDRLRGFSRRAVVLGGMQGALLSVLGIRLGYLQLVEGDRYQTLADKNRINTKLIAPSRGRILDRNGINLAINEQNFRVLMVPEVAENPEKVLQNLANIIPMRPADMQRILREIEKKPDFVAIQIADNLSWQEVAQIEVSLPDLPGISIDVGEVRSYPLAVSTAHLVGYVGAVSKSELSGERVLTLPGFKIGKTGIEKAYDEELRGKAGAAQVEVNVVGREVRELSRTPPKQGDDVTLTIDSELQNYMQDRLSKEKSASAIVMDAHSGAIYGLVSSPSFDPNLFTHGISAAQWEELLSDPTVPLTNKAIGGQYPPGSTFKMVTALAGLEERVITRNTSVHCPGHYDLGGHRFHCWKWAGHGRVDLVDALAESCDTFFYSIARDIGIDKIAKMARRFGLAEKPGSELEGERPGLMPTEDWKMGHFGQKWQAGETIVASIGQGYIQTTPLQLAVMTARMVNGGFAVRPWVTGLVGNRFAVDQSWHNIGIKKAHLDLVIRGMNRAVIHRKGTANESAMENSAYAMGGKTGTAQVRRISMQERTDGVRNQELPWKLRHHALFVGYAPIRSPRYVCSVVVEHGGSGSATAAPIARDILLKVQELDPVSKQLHMPAGMRKNVGTIVPPKKPLPRGNRS